MLDTDRAYRLTLGGVNAYLVDDGGDWTLIDAGMPWHTDRVRRKLESASVAPAEIERVLLTHYDLDHVGTLASLGLEAPVHVADPDAAYLEGTGSPPLGNHKGLFQRLTGPLITRPELPIERVTDGDRVGGFEVLRSPGHTPGHSCFYHAEYDLAILGDLVSESDGALNASPWFISYDTDEVATSVTAVADRLGAFDVACVGHGDPIRSGGGDALGQLAASL